MISAQDLTKILQQPGYSVTGSFTAAPVTPRPTVWRGERDFQRAVVDAYAAWAAANGIDAVLYHIANENAHRQPGIVAGMPDLMLCAARCGSGALFLELKVGGGKPSQAQLDLHHRLRKAGYRVVVVWDSVDEVMQAIEKHLAEGMMGEREIDWVEYVRKVEATIDLLSKQTAALAAERDDLAAKLDAAHKELHELRIKQGMVQP